MPLLVTQGASVVWASLFVIGFGALGLAIGYRISRWLGVPSGGTGMESAVIAVGLGVGTLQFVPFTLGALGLLSESSLRLTMGVVAVAAAWDLRAAATRVRAAIGALESPPIWLVAWAAALAPSMGIAVLFALTPTLDPDGMIYHLTVPKRWLASGSLAYLPTYPYSNPPMGVEMLFTIGLVFAGDAAAKLLHFALGMVGALGLYFAGKRVRGKTVGVIAVALYLVGPAGVSSLLGWAYVEGVTAFAAIAATLAWLLWFREKQAGWLRAAALLAGFGVSFKLTSALFPISLGALTFIASWSDAKEQGRRGLPPVAPLLGLAPFLVAPVAPWFVRAAIVTGNPFFPLLAGKIPSRDFSPAIAKGLEQYNRYLTWGQGLGPVWTLERRRLLLLAVALAACVLGGIVFGRLRSWMARGVALVVLSTVLVQLSAVGLYVRYWVPLLAVLQLPIIAFFDRSAARGRWGVPALVAVTALGSVVHVRRGGKIVPYDLAGLVRTSLGLESQRSFLLRQLPLFAVFERANRELPPDSRIQLSSSCIGFYLDRTTLCAEFEQDALRVGSWNEYIADAQRLGITHVMAPRAWVDGSSAPVVAFRGHEDQLVGRLVREGRGRLVAAALDQALYSVSWDGIRPDVPGAASQR